MSEHEKKSVLDNAPQELLELERQIVSTHPALKKINEFGLERTVSTNPVLSDPRFPAALRLNLVRGEYDIFAALADTDFFLKYMGGFNKEDVLGLAEFLFVYCYPAATEGVLNFYFSFCRHYGTRFVFKWLVEISGKKNVYLPKVYIEELYPKAVEERINKKYFVLREKPLKKEDYIWSYLPVVSTSLIDKWYKESGDRRLAIELLKRGRIEVLDDNVSFAELFMESKYGGTRTLPLGLIYLFSANERSQKKSFYGKEIRIRLAQLGVSSLTEFPEKLLKSKDDKISSFSYLFSDRIRRYELSEMEAMNSNPSLPLYFAVPEIPYQEFSENLQLQEYVKTCCHHTYDILSKSIAAQSGTMKDILYSDVEESWRGYANPMTPLNFLPELARKGFLPVKMRLMRLRWAGYELGIKDLEDLPHISILWFMRSYKDMLIWNSTRQVYEWKEGFDVEVGEQQENDA